MALLMIALSLGFIVTEKKPASAQVTAPPPLTAAASEIHALIPRSDMLEPGSRPLFQRWSCADPNGRCTWERTYGGALKDKAYGIVALPDGGAVLAGHSNSQPGFGQDGWVLRVDRWGDRLWDRRVGGQGLDQIYGVVDSGDGALVLGGHTRSQGSGESDFWILKIDLEGNLIWESTFGGRGDDRARSLTATSSGHYALAGSTQSGDDPEGDAWLVLVDAQGRSRWERSFGGPGEDGLFHVAALPDGDLAAAGYTQTGPDTGFDLWVMRLTPEGEMRWQRRFHRGVFDAGTAAVPTADNGLLLAGVTSQDAFRHDKVWVLRLDRDGELLWQKVLGGAKPDAAWAAAALPDNTYAVAAATASYGAGSTDAWLFCLDDAGNLRWQRTYGGKLWDRPTAVASIPGGGIFLLGSTTSRGAGYEDFWLLRLDARGRF
jgi:hypothetical protein